METVKESNRQGGRQCGQNQMKNLSHLGPMLPLYCGQPSELAKKKRHYFIISRKDSTLLVHHWNLNLVIVIPL